jgi:hypothetical protein
MLTHRLVEIRYLPKGSVFVKCLHPQASCKPHAVRCTMVQSGKSQINCSICNTSVSLETAKTDEAGKVVCEECYALREVLKHATQPTQATD